MTREEAARILDPETTAEAYVEYSYYGGFEGEKKWIEAVSEACRIGAAALIKLADSVGKVTAEVVEARRMGSDAIRELDRQEKQELLVGDEWTSVEDHLPEFTGEYMCRVVTPTVYGKYSVRHLSLKFCQYDDSWVVQI